MSIFLLIGLFALAPPTGIRAHDLPSDGGGAMLIEWTLSPDDAKLDGYQVYRSENGVDFEKVGFIGRGRTGLEDQTEDGKPYTYKVAAVADTVRAYSEISAAAVTRAQWLDLNKLNILVSLIVLSGIIIYFITQARKRSKDMFIRKIAGLQAIDDAIGRATEMGRPILYTTGLGSIDIITTIASLNILGEVARKVANYNSKLINPNYDPVVYTVAREIIKEAYTSAGRPDAFDPNSVYFITDSQFAYAAALDGIMLRERPATNFLIGYFYAESLIIAETGATTGAIQIAGTDAIPQLPFLVTACDYTLIGEELYAASAYISREPLLLGAIKGEDLGKVVISGLLIIASLIGILTRFPVLELFK
jgi:hypothetical protein